jgi:bifunctional enzyme CysN/CysC
MTEKPIEDRARLLVKQTTRTVPARIDEILSVVDIEAFEDKPAPGRLELNDLGVVRLRLAEPLVVDPYARNRATGAFILVDEATNDTIGAGMVVEATP